MDRDIVIRAVAEGKEANTQRAEEIVSTDSYNAKPNDRVVDVIRKMGDKQVRRIPVVTDNGYLRGIISMADVLSKPRKTSNWPRLLKRFRAARLSGAGFSTSGPLFI